MSCSVVVDGAPANPTTRGPIYRLIRPRRSIKKELLAQQRNNNNRNESEISGNLQGKEHQNIWQKPSAFRQSLKTKLSSDKNETSGAKPSGIYKPNSQCFFGNEDKSSSQRDFRLTTNSKDCSQSESDTTEKQFLLSQGRSYFIYGYDENSKIAIWNKILSSQEENQHCLKSNLTPSSSQHTLLKNPENTLQKHRPTDHQKSVWTLFENSKHEINVQREPDYVNTDWLRKGCATQFWPSLSSAQESCEFQVTQQTSAPTAPSRRSCERSENVMKIESGARTCRASFTDLREAPRNFRRNQSYSQETSFEKNKDITEHHQPCHTASSHLRLNAVHKKCKESTNRLINGYPCSETFENGFGSQGSLNLSLLSSDCTSSRFSQVIAKNPCNQLQLNSYSSTSSVNSFSATPVLRENVNMVTRRFKKGSVYETLASKSGLDFAPLVQGKTCWGKNESVKDLSFTAQSSQSLDITGCCQGIDSGKCAENKFSAFNAKNQRVLSEENLTVQTNGSSIQRVVINSENPKPQLFSLTLPSNMRMNTRETNNKCSPPFASSDLKKSNMTHQKTKLTHEKFPSWPVASGGLKSSTSPLPVTMASFRSNSLTDETDYPKIRAEYTRPKKTFKISTNQLQPVQEKSGHGSKHTSNTEHCDTKIPLDSRMMYCKPTAATCLSLKESLNRNIPDNIKDFQNCPLHIPTCYGDKQYNVSSLPERDIPIDEAKDKPASSHNSKPYWNKYDNVVKDCIGYSVSESSAHECSLTSFSSLEKWNELYALNIPQPLENDTPFLDRLRLECQALSKTWPPPPGSDILETSSEAETLVGSTDSGSESSRDTLKWHGSYSDLSNLSTHMSNRSSLFDSGLSTMSDSGHLSPQSLYDGTTSTNHLETIERDNLTSKHELQQQNIAHSSKVQPAERHDSKSVLYYVPGSRQSIDEIHKNVHISSSKEKNQNNYDISGISVAQRIKMLQQQMEERKPNKSLISSSTLSVFPEVQPLVKRPNRNYKETKLLVSDVSHSGMSKTTASHENTEEFCIVGQTQVGTNFPNFNVRSCFSEPPDRGQRIIYLDPEKKHRVSDPKLKAIQKKAVMSFCQRQKKISESQPAGQELSLCTAMALPVDHPMKQPTDQELCISTTTALVVEEPIKQSFGQKLRTEDTKVASLNNFRSNNVSEQHMLSLPAKYKQGLENYLSRLRSADLRILNSLKNERKKECDYVPEYRSFYNNHPGLLQTTDLIHGRSPEAIPQITSRTFNQHNLSVPNLAGIQLSTVTNQNHHSTYNTPSSQEHLAVGLSKMFARGNHTHLQTSQELETKVPSNTMTSAIQGAQDSKEIPPLNRDPSDSTTYFRSYKSPRKAQVKEIHHSNETATVKVITPDGVTLVETDRSDTSRDENKLQPPPRIPPRRVNKPPLQPHQRPTRPPPPPPILEVENRRTCESDYAELCHPHKEAILCSSSCHVKKESDRRPLVGIGDASKCSSPELPLPPPPNTTDTEIINDGQPLPSPPHLQEEEPPAKGLPQSLIVYPKNSYMSYRSERKLGRQGFDGNYWRSSSTSGSLDLSYPVSKSSQDGQIRVSPASWEKLHNIRKQGTTLIFHSNSIRERTWSDSRCLVDRGSPSSSSDHKFSVTPDQSFQLENISEDTQTRTTVSTNKDSSAGSDSQFQSDDASHGSSSPLNKLILSHSLKQTDNQSGDSLITNHEVSFQYEPEVNIHCTKFLQEKVIENHNPVLNGQYVGVPTLHYAEEKETMVDERFSQEKPHQSIIVQQNNTSNHHGQQVNDESNKGLTVTRISSGTQTTDTPKLGRKYKTREEIECERLSKDFVNHCDDTILKNLLVPAPNHKTISDYMEGLFNLELERGGQPTRKTSANQDEMIKQAASFCLSNMSGRERNELSHNSAYFTTSESKAKLLTGYIQETGPEDLSLNNELSIKKEELIASIERKLECLRLEHTVLREEMVQNEVLGKEVTSRVEQLVKPNEFEKYRLHIEELEKIINLLLSLSGRLARAQNALFCLSIEAGEEEKRVLQEKYDKLLGQHEEARRLKESIDKRSHQVSTFLHRYLSSEEYAEYDHFVKMKSKLLIDAREISEKIKLGAEQLAALQNNVNFQIWKQAQTKTQVLPGT